MLAPMNQGVEGVAPKWSVHYEHLTNQHPLARHHWLLGPRSVQPANKAFYHHSDSFAPNINCLCAIQYFCFQFVLSKFPFLSTKLSLETENREHFRDKVSLGH